MSIFLQYAPLTPPIQELECELYAAEEDQDEKRIELLENEIVRFREEWERNYPFHTDGWTKVEDLEQVVSALKSKIYSNPGYHLRLKYTYDWGDYFTLELPEQPWDSKLYLDLEKLLELVSQAKAIGEHYMTFDFG